MLQIALDRQVRQSRILNLVQHSPFHRYLSRPANIGRPACKDPGFRPRL